MCDTHTHTLMNAVWERVLSLSPRLTMNIIYIVVELKYCYFNSTTMRIQTCAACKSFMYLHVAIISFKLLHSEWSRHIGVKVNTHASLWTLHIYFYINLYFSLKYKFIFLLLWIHFYLNSFFILFHSRARKLSWRARPHCQFIL